MEILDSALGKDIEDITGPNNTFSRQYWDCEIHNPNETLVPFKVMSFDKIRDYENNFGDELVVEVVIPAGVYAYRVYPFLDKLELTLYRHDPKSDIAGRLTGADAVSHERYTAIVINPPASAVENNGRTQPSERNLDLSNLFTIKIQLITKAMDQMRLRSVGGIFRNCTAEEVIKTVLTNESLKLDVSSEYLPKGVDIVPVKNPIKRDHINIKQGTRMVEVPKVVHQECGGVYPTGFSYYFQNGIWYVYPAYDTARFETTPKTMTIINVPAMKMPGIEKTYITNGNHLTILATGQSKVVNASEKMILNDGNGVRFADANQFMEDFVEVTGNKALASRGKINNEFTTIDRDGQVNNVQMSNTRITANPLLEYSKLAARDGAIMLVSWENSDPDLIYPGMPIRMKYLDGEDIKQVDGVVLKLHNYTQLGRDGMMSNRHISTTNMSLFIKRTVYKDV